MDLLDRFRAHLCSLPLPPGRALVAVSGGPDSTALLALLLRTRDAHRLELIAAHVDHGIHAASGAVAEQVRRFAASQGVTCFSGAMALGSGAGETPARITRHAWLAAAAGRQEAGIIFLGHHADDQAETILMRVLEGSGPAGLGGMPAVAGRLVRPLLPFSRIELAEFVHRERLPVWIDPANTDPRHLRSWIRVDVLPALRARLPAVEQRLRRLGRAAARQRAGWDAALDRIPELDIRQEVEAISVAGAPLGGYDSALSDALLMATGRRVGCPIGPVRAGRLRRLVVEGRSGTGIPLGAGWQAELSFGRLRLLRVADVKEVPPWTLEQASGERLWGRWRLRWRPDAAPERQERAAFVAWFRPGPLQVRTWKPGDRVRPLAGVGRRLVVRCFQDQQVSRRLRTAWPVLAQEEAVVWVPGVCRSDALVPAGGSEAVRVDAEHA